MIDANSCALVPLDEPLRVSSWYVVVSVKRDLLTLSKPKYEALRALGIMEKSLWTL